MSPSAFFFEPSAFLVWFTLRMISEYLHKMDRALSYLIWDLSVPSDGAWTDCGQL